jgi:hypothetical protein
MVSRYQNAMSALRPFIPQYQTKCCSVANVEKGHVWTSGNRGQVISVRLHRDPGILVLGRTKGAHYDQLCRPGCFTEDHDALHC